MDHQQAINLELFAHFEERGIEFAFPTRKVLLARSEGGGSQPLPTRAVSDRHS